MANTKISSAAIKAGAILNTHIADNTLTAAQLHTSFVIGSGHIPANTVTIAHLAVTDGTANQVLKTDGSGTLSFTTIETNSISQGNTNVTVSDTGTDGKITMTTEGTARWEVTPTGHILPLLDDTYDIGSASKKIRDIYVSTGSIKMGTDTVLSINSDGDFEINDAAGAPKKLKVDEIEIGTGTDKLILKRGTDGKLESRKKVNGTLQAAENLFSIGSHTTNDITEGSSKLFYTAARADARIVNAGSANWNTAFGWGNHASAGYITSYVNTTYSIQDGELSQNNFTNADHSKLDNMAAYATAVVASLPSSPDANTIYFVTGD